MAASWRGHLRASRAECRVWGVPRVVDAAFGERWRRLVVAFGQAARGAGAAL